jgi:tungstate transport system substrate-binding protein
MLVPVFEQKSGYRVKVVAVDSGQALALAAKGAGDVVLTRAPNTEKQYLMDGTVVRRRLVMHNTFLLAGPPTDPAHVRGTPKASDALKKIAEAKALFISRGDDSGTHKLEMTLWQQAGIKPVGDWYLESKQGMGNTLRIAREKHAYVLCDRATFLASQQTPGLIALVEGDLAFLNLYHVAETNPKKHPQINTQGGKAFADFLLSADAQDRLHQFGVSKVREAFFHPDGGRTEEELQQQCGV